MLENGLCKSFRDRRLDWYINAFISRVSDEKDLATTVASTREELPVFSLMSDFVLAE